jgi:hypothetical protein
MVIKYLISKPLKFSWPIFTRPDGFELKLCTFFPEILASVSDSFLGAVTESNDLTHGKNLTIKFLLLGML